MTAPGVVRGAEKSAEPSRRARDLVQQCDARDAPARGDTVGGHDVGGEGELAEGERRARIPGTEELGDE